jgi:hypothetical protein
VLERNGFGPQRGDAGASLFEAGVDVVERLEIVPCEVVSMLDTAINQHQIRETHTGKGELWENKQVMAVQLVGIYSVQDSIGAVEVVVDLADPGVELQTGDPHGVKADSDAIAA